MIITT